MNNLHRSIFLFLGIAGIASFAAAQSSTGTVKGVLSDESGAGIPAATLTISNTAGKRTAQSQADGTYIFSGVQPGDYTLSVTYTGFATYNKAVTVNAGATVQLPVQLSVTTEKQEITVKGDPGPSISVEPDNNATALVIKGDDLMGGWLSGGGGDGN